MLRESLSTSSLCFPICCRLAAQGERGREKHVHMFCAYVQHRGVLAYDHACLPSNVHNHHSCKEVILVKIILAHHHTCLISYLLAIMHACYHTCRLSYLLTINHAYYHTRVLLKANKCAKVDAPPASSYEEHLAGNIFYFKEGKEPLQVLYYLSAWYHTYVISYCAYYHSSPLPSSTFHFDSPNPVRSPRAHSNLIRPIQSSPLPPAHSLQPTPSSPLPSSPWVPCFGAFPGCLKAIYIFVVRCETKSTRATMTTRHRLST